MGMPGLGRLARRRNAHSGMRSPRPRLRRDAWRFEGKERSCLPSEEKYGTAACYAVNIEDACIEQIRSMLDMPFAEGANTAIMPDAHFGLGCTVGTTMRVADAVVPNLVGVDIGCGMLTVDLGRKPIDLLAFDEACHQIPSGFSVWEGRKEQFDLEELRCCWQLKDTKRIARSLGTLGGGNHFIEIDVASGRHAATGHSLGFA